ncbi:cyclin-dependent kinase F-4-like protein isoform X1 [Tanacetum coccineum]
MSKVLLSFRLWLFSQVAGVNHFALIPSASKEVVSLIGVWPNYIPFGLRDFLKIMHHLALCSWDPSKRPTAVEGLQHPFFQAVTARMSPSVGLNGRGAIEGRTIPFTVVKAIANSPLEETLQTRMQETKKLALNNAKAYQSL